MGEYSESIMVALLPTSSYWTTLELPHMTLVYVGQISDFKPSHKNALTKMVMRLAADFPVMTLDVMGRSIFGKDHEQVDVFRLRPTMDLSEMHDRVITWNASQYQFNPHVTVGKVGSINKLTPKQITFDRVVLSWGDSNSIFDLQRQRL